MKNSQSFCSCVCLLLLTFTFAFLLSVPCYAKKSVYVPDQLKPWVDWVLHEKKEQLECIPQYNDARVYQCSWPSELELNLTDQGGKFRQSWQVYSETWVQLPGNNLQWPLDVEVNGESQVILQKDLMPGILLQPGTYTVTGHYAWPRLPENISVPTKSPLVSLRLNDKKIVFPEIDGTGRLWLKRSQGEKKIENRLEIKSFRLIDDTIPARVTIYFTLDVAGSARRITLGPLYNPEKSTPFYLQSKLPTKLKQDGSMVMQVRPGQYSVRLTLRQIGELEELSLNSIGDGFWPQQEVWSFRARPDFRQVETSGAAPVDPVQTSMPKNWQQYPAYRMVPGDTLQFKEIKRGDPLPAPDQLSLDRSLWLRFDGSGYSIQDRINGKKNTNWRLEIDPAIELGRVTVDGSEQFITHKKGSEKAGVELRNGLVSLIADSVLKGNISTIPATGWDHDFQQVSGRIYLPPGWKLLNASGIDNIPRTWVKRWTLLDFFIVLIFTIALAKLFSKPLAAIAFLTLILTYHEPGAPRYVWLALLIGFTLLKFLPDNKFKKLVRVYHGLTSLVLVIIVIPYAIGALRIGIYPQLAMPWASMSEYSQRQHPAAKLAVAGKISVEDVMPVQMEVESNSVARLGKVMAPEKLKSRVLQSAAPSPKASYYDTKIMQQDPKALTQTGPGMPKWQPFETVNFSWTGPVNRDQMVSFTLIGPTINMILAFMRVFLIAILALGMFGLRFRPKSGFSFKGLQSLTFLPVLLFLLATPGLGQGSEIPSRQLLDELQARLLKTDECFPSCANISDSYITINDRQLSIELTIDAQVDSAIPLPSHVKQWLPREVMVDNSPASGLLRKDNYLWLQVPAGKHRVQMSGPIRQQNSLQLPFPLKPHKLGIKADGWLAEGLYPDGKFADQIQFKRLAKQDSKTTEILETGILPPFVTVKRNLLLGLVWKIETTIQRLSPSGSAVVLDIPLLPGESVTTAGVRVLNGVAKINLGANQNRLSWQSFLQPTDSIVLNHKKTNSWSEIWQVDVSPIFHLEYEGIPVVLHKSGNRWYPTWYPWPGETVSLQISRPQGVAGQTLTIERSHLELRPGQKSSSATISLTIKSSQGGRHTISLPDGAKLQEVKIKGRIQPIRQDGRKVTLPITPGSQNIELKWLEPQGISSYYQTSSIDLASPSVNASVDIVLPANRWPLFLGGEQLVGPAILFWSQLIILVLIAFALARTGWTPLRFHHWFLLGLGISMSNLAIGLIITGWLVALGFRKKAANIDGRKFNLLQVALALFTVAALASLVFTISMGLLGHPDMNIVGNGSYSGLLRWYQDVSDRTLPQAWLLSIPMLIYRIGMLAWALWISFWLIGILKWGWQQFTAPVIWRKIPARVKTKKNKEPK